MKNYYFADAEYIDRIYGNESPVCVDEAETDEYGVYNS